MSALRCDTSQRNFKLNGLLGPQAVVSVAAVGIGCNEWELKASQQGVQVEVLLWWNGVSALAHEVGLVSPRCLLLWGESWQGHWDEIREDF